MEERDSIMEIDTLIEHVKVFNSYEKSFKTANVAIKDGRFMYIGEKIRVTFKQSSM